MALRRRATTLDASRATPTRAGSTASPRPPSVVTIPTPTPRSTPTVRPSQPPTKLDPTPPPPTRPTDIGMPGPTQSVPVVTQPETSMTFITPGYQYSTGLVPGASGPSIPGIGTQVPGSAPISGWKCTLLQSFGLPCTVQGVTQGIAMGISALTGSGGSGGSQSQCPGGTVLNPNNGVCEFPGSPGDVSTPGGPSGTGGMGVFGIPNVPAQVVGEITRENGQQTLIRRCPTGLVLGKDNMCYAKGSIPNQHRKWPRAAKPPVSAYDAKMMRKYGPKGSKRNSIKKLAGTAGFTCKNR